MPRRWLLPLFFVLSGCGGWSGSFEAGPHWYMNVAGSGPEDVYVVGGTPEVGHARHFDGAAWSEVDFGTPVPLLNWAHASAPDDVFVVGNEGTLLHFDGAAWRRFDAPTSDPLWGVWGAAANDVWAVGGSGFSSSRPQIFHYDGAAWAEVAVPQLQRQNVFALFKVWGTSATNVLAVGQEGVVLRWDGLEWKEEDAGARDDLISLWGTGEDNIVAVGGRGNGQVARWDGSAWEQVSLSPLPGLNGVWMGEADTAWIAGGNGTIARLDVATLQPEVEEVETSLEFHSVFGVGPKLYAVGGNLLTGASTRSFEGVALERGR